MGAANRAVVAQFAGRARAQSPAASRPLAPWIDVVRGGRAAGTMYEESGANALTVYLVNRHAARRATPVVSKGGLPGHRLKRVLDYIAESLERNISLPQLAAIAGMSPHYFSELFKRSTGRSPHNYVLLQRIERAKQLLRDPKRSIIDAGLDAGFRNPSHFARMFRKIAGTTPSRFRADHLGRATGPKVRA